MLDEISLDLLDPTFIDIQANSSLPSRAWDLPGTANAVSWFFWSVEEENTKPLEPTRRPEA